MVRVRLDSGERIVGVRYPQILIPIAEADLNEQRNLAMLLAQHNMASQKPLSQLPLPPQINCSQSALQLMNGCSPQHKLLPPHVMSALQSAHVKTLLPSNATNLVHEENVIFKLEAVTPVSDKHLLKATTPPVTLKNYFKPKVKVDIESETESSGPKLTTDSELALPSKEASKNGSNFASTVNASSSSASSQPHVIVPASQARKRVTSGSSSKLPPKKKSRLSNNKPQQNSIFASFKKMQTLRDEKVDKARTCPICSKNFEQTVSNTEINEHVDNCLIE